MEEKERSEQIALFITIENFIGFCDQELNMPIDLSPVLKELTTIGRVTLRESFGDISKTVWAIINYESRGNPTTDLQFGRRIDTVRKTLNRNMIRHEDISDDSQYKNSQEKDQVIEVLRQMRLDFTNHD